MIAQTEAALAAMREVAAEFPDVHRGPTGAFMALSAKEHASARVRLRYVGAKEGPPPSCYVIVATTQGGHEVYQPAGPSNLEEPLIVNVHTQAKSADGAVLPGNVLERFLDANPPVGAAFLTQLLQYAPGYMPVAQAAPPPPRAARPAAPKKRRR